MSDNFNFELDHARRFLKIKLQGSWECATVDRYRDTVQATVRRMSIRGYSLEEAVILIDTRNLAVQAREVADYYSAVPIYSAAQPRKIATLVVSRLVGMQLRRIGTGVREIFEREDEALTWLFSA